MQLIQSAIAEGRWSAIIAAEGSDPVIEIWHLGARLEVLSAAPVAEHPGQYRLGFDIPPGLLNDGVQTFAVKTGKGADIGHFSILTGTALDQDLRAELDLLRAELDLLKKAFRRHCAQS